MAEPPVVLITGTSRGIGRALAEHFLAADCSVAGCSRSAVDLGTPRYLHHELDLAREADVVRFVRRAASTFGRIDVAINNAGIAAMTPALLAPATVMSDIVTTNFLGAAVVCRESAKVMTRQRAGRIVNISSVAVPLLLEGEAAYAASKSALVTYTRILAREVASYGITCNVVALPPIQTDLLRGVPQPAIDRLIERLAIKRYATIDDVVNVIDFLIRPESGMITGQVLTLGGV